MTKKIDLRTLVIKGSRVMVLIVLVLVFSIFTRTFLEPSNISNILMQQVPFLILLGLSMTISMVVGGIDLSIGANISLTSFVCAMILQAGGGSIIAILAALMLGLLIGIVNGILVAKIGVPPFVATYSLQWIAQGVALVISKGGQINGFDSFRAIFTTWNGTYLLIAIVVVAIAWFVFMKTTYGRKIYCVGCNQQAAKLSGMKKDAILISAYAIGGFIASIAGVMYIAKLGAAEPTLGSDFTMEAMAVALIGGASFAGAKSKVSNALIGGLIVVVMENGMLHIGIPGIWQDFVQGLIIIAAIVMERGLEKLRVEKKETSTV